MTLLPDQPASPQAQAPVVVWLTLLAIPVLTMVEVIRHDDGGQQ